MTSSSPVSSRSAADLHSGLERKRETLAAWADWTSGHRNWPFGKLEPHESLYDFQGSAIFLKEVGVHTLLFFRSDIHDDGDFFVAAAVSDEERDALKEGRLSVRGAFTARTCWLFDVDFECGVRRYEQVASADIEPLLPPSGVALYPGLPRVPDVLEPPGLRIS